MSDAAMITWGGGMVQGETSGGEVGQTSGGQMSGGQKGLWAAGRSFPHDAPPPTSQRPSPKLSAHLDAGGLRLAVDDGAVLAHGGRVEAQLLPDVPPHERPEVQPPPRVRRLLLHYSLVTAAKKGRESS